MGQDVDTLKGSQIPDRFDAVVVGAGFAGMYMVHRLATLNYRVQAFERGEEVGGTWYWNRYPGARCDVVSMEYSYSFSEELQQEWEWRERYAGQPEILQYASHVADRFDLRRHYRFNTVVVSAIFDQPANCWNVTTDRGDTVATQFLIFATGCLSSFNLPAVEGRENFGGEIYHTGRWSHEEVDVSKKNVGVIGTGSSGIQAIPYLAEQGKSLTVFQRTPHYSVPARNRPLEPDEVEETKAHYQELRAANRMMQAALGATFEPAMKSGVEATDKEREEQFVKRWERGGFEFLGAFNDLLLNKKSNDFAAEFVRNRIAEIVRDPQVAKTLMPDNVVGCKRICLDTNYYETYNQKNVHLVDLRENPLKRITKNGLIAGESEYLLDVIVFATGFDAMTGSLLKIDIRGSAGKSLRKHWETGPKTYLGLSVSGFPNMFMVTGPGSPSVLTNMFVSIEQHVDWITNCLNHIRAHSWSLLEAQPEAEDAWVERVNAIANLTLYPTCNSWYLGANIPGKPQVFMPHIGFPGYVEKCEAVVDADYDGFAHR